MICRFDSVKYEFISGDIKSVKNSNIAYVKPHILKVKGNDYLIFENYELEKANQSSTELKEKNSDIKELVRDLKNLPLYKRNFILKEEDKNKLIDYIDKADKTNNDYQNIQELSVTLIDVDEELEEKREKINVLE